MTNLARLLEQLPTPQVLVDLKPDHRIVFANPAFVDAFGYASGELAAADACAWWIPKHPAPDLSGQPDGGLARCIANATHAGGQAPRIEGRIRCRDGVCRPVWLSIALIDDSAVLTFEDQGQNQQIEDELRKSEALYRSFFNLPLVGTAITSVEKGWIEVNDRTCEILGYPREQLFQKNWAEISHPDDVEADLVLFERMLSGEINSYSLEKRFIRPDGSAIPCFLIGGRCLQTTVPEEYFYMQIMDISERTQLLQSLRTAEAYYQALFSGAGEAIMLSDHSGFIDCNVRALQLFGFDSKKEFLSMHQADLSTPCQPDGQNSRIAAHARISAAFETGYQYFEWRHCRRDGTPFDSEVSLVAIDTPKGKILHAIVTNISERKQAQAALQREQDRYRLLADNISDCIWTTDLQGGFTFISPSIEKMLGYTVEEALQMTSLDFLTPAARQEWARVTRGAALQSAKRPSQSPEVTEHQCLRKDGTMIWLEVSTNTLRNVAGEIIGTSGVSRDITARKQAEQRLVQRSQELEYANNAKSQFLAHMSHEIRTPMNAIFGFAQVLAQQNLNKEQQAIIQHITRSGGTLLGIINDILDWSKIEAGHLALDIQPMQLDGLLKYIENLFSNQAKEKGLELHVESATLNRLLLCDALRLEQVLINLTGNAIKFTRKGRITIRVRMQGVSEESARLRFEVADTGIGISETVRPKLFQPFIQADNTITRRFGGTGLGLAISRHLVESMGGEIGVDSEPAHGSVFWFELTCQLGEEDNLPAACLAPVTRGPRLSGLRLLIVDDNQLNRLAAEYLLGEEGANLVLLENGQQAIDCLRIDPSGTDLVLMDIQMPVMDGLTATRVIREQLRLDNLPVIALTAGVLAEEKQNAMDAGCSGFLPKPLDLDQTVDIILQHCRPAAPPPRRGRVPRANKTVS